METILTIVHIIVCFFLVIIVLLQHGKGADMGATFGGSSQTVFGTEGPVPLLNKITTGAAIIFMVTSLLLAYMSANLGNGSVMEGVKAPVATPQEVELAPITIPLPQSATDNGTESVPAEFPVKTDE